MSFTDLNNLRMGPSNALLVVVLFSIAHVTNLRIVASGEDRMITKTFSEDIQEDMNILDHWFENTNSLLPVDTSVNELRRESCGDGKYRGKEETMCGAFRMGEHKFTSADCLAVYMYSTNFGNTYNRDIRNGNFTPYRYFSAHLHSAVLRLAKERPLKNGTILYRGSKYQYDIDTKKPFYFTQFTSSSLDLQVAEAYGTIAILIFEEKVPRWGANLTGLTEYPEEEVLLSPFEAFEHIKTVGNKIHVKRSKRQRYFENSKALPSQSPLRCSGPDTSSNGVSRMLVVVLLSIKTCL